MTPSRAARKSSNELPTLWRVRHRASRLMPGSAARPRSYARSPSKSAPTLLSSGIVVCTVVVASWEAFRTACRIAHPAVFSSRTPDEARTRGAVLVLPVFPGQHLQMIVATRRFLDRESHRAVP